MIELLGLGGTTARGYLSVYAQDRIPGFVAGWFPEMLVLATRTIKHILLGAAHVDYQHMFEPTFSRSVSNWRSFLLWCRQGHCTQDVCPTTLNKQLSSTFRSPTERLPHPKIKTNFTPVGFPSSPGGHFHFLFFRAGSNWLRFPGPRPRASPASAWREPRSCGRRATPSSRPRTEKR